MAWYWEQHLPDPTDREHPDAAPLRADVTGLPPTLVVTCGWDPLRDEGLLRAQRLHSAGVTVKQVHEPALSKRRMVTEDSVKWS
jgi:acetyl esterase